MEKNQDRASETEAKAAVVRIMERLTRGTIEPDVLDSLSLRETEDVVVALIEKGIAELRTAALPDLDADDHRVGDEATRLHLEGLLRQIGRHDVDVDVSTTTKAGMVTTRISFDRPVLKELIARGKVEE